VRFIDPDLSENVDQLTTNLGLEIEGIEGQIETFYEDTVSKARL
jgi:hypothetical protein